MPRNQGGPLRWLVRSAMCDLLPRHAGLPGLADTDIDGFLARTAREATLAVRAGLVAGALVYVLSPLFTVLVPLPSMLLPAGLRDRHADRIASTRFYLARQAVFLVKMYACMCWGQDEAVRRQLHVLPYPTDPGTWRTS